MDVLLCYVADSFFVALVDHIFLLFPNLLFLNAVVNK